MNKGDSAHGSSTGTGRGRRKSRANVVRRVGMTMLGLFALGLIAELLLPA